MRGIGPKSGSRLLERFGNLEGIFEGVDGVGSLEIRGSKGLQELLRLKETRWNTRVYYTTRYHIVYAQANRRPSGVVIASQITNNIIIVCGVVSSILDKIFFFFGFCSGKRENVSE